MSVFDAIGHSMAELIHYIFNDPIIKALSLLDPDTCHGHFKELPP